MSLGATAAPLGPAHNDHAILHRAWWQLLVLGVISVLVGMLAISSSVVATMASVMVFGVLLLIAGVTEIIHAFLVRRASSFALHLLAAAMYLIGGVFMLEDPVRAATVLTLLMAASFFVGGVLRIVFALAMHFPSWGWVLLNGAVDLVLGIMIFNRWPYDTLWVIGLFVGIDLLFHGWTWIILGLNLRTFEPAPSAKP
jgi:uncharacterized membrane protein HdeD (DUF308 family)